MASRTPSHLLAWIDSAVTDQEIFEQEQYLGNKLLRIQTMPVEQILHARTVDDQVAATVLSREIDVLIQWIEGQETYASANV